MAGKKVAIVSVSSILLVAMVAAVIVGVNRKSTTPSGAANSSSNNGEVSTANKAVQTICQPTDYKQTCESTLAPVAGNITNPKDLVKIAFNITVAHVEEAMKKSAVLQQAAKDPSTSDAFKVCNHLLDFAVDDLRKSMDRIGAFDPTKLDEYVSDLKTWLSGVVTYQEDCKEAFDNTTSGDSGKKMKELLKTSDELIRNALAMVDEVSGALEKAQGVTTGSRRLLNSDGLPTWVDAGRRSLLQTRANYNALRPNVVVSKSGRKGHFKSINAAINAVPEKNNRPFVIFIEPGVYNEYVLVPKNKWNVVLLGAGPYKTKITGNKSFQKGVKTMYTATVAVEGRNFFARGITFENTAGPEGHQAVALRVTADMAIIQGCEINAYQDTLYTQSQRQFYTDTTVVGTVDFIFGDARAVFQKCKLVVRRPGPGQSCMVTAQGRTYKRQDTGYVIQKCTIVGTPAFKASRAPAYLGRPWKELSRTIVMQTFIDNSIRPEGWAPWEGKKFLDTCFYGEYANTGPGANTGRRVRWPCIKKITPKLAASFSATVFVGADQWIRPTGIPYIARV